MLEVLGIAAVIALIAISAANAPTRTLTVHPLFVKGDTHFTKEALGRSGTHSILTSLNAW
jgi:hypothetical protein